MSLSGLRRVLLTGGLGLSFALVTVGVALGQSAVPFPPKEPPPNDPQGQSREQTNPASQLDATRRQRPNDVFSGPAKEACQLSDDSALAFDFHQGVIEDSARILSDRDKQVAWNNALGRKITPRELCEIRDRLALRIFQKGILARVIIPPQTIAGGVVTFRVIAAKIISVRYQGTDIGPAQSKAEALLNHLRHRDTFDLDTAQRWLLLVNDLPGIQAQAKIVHSTAPGAPPEGLDLIVSMRRTPLDELGEISNANSKILGPWSGIARIDLNSQTALGERTSLIAYSTLGNNRQEVAQLIETARIGDSGLFAQASFSYGHSSPGDILKELKLKGDSFTGSFELDYPLIRLQRRTLILAAGMDFANQTTTFPGGQPLADDTLRVVWVRADASFASVDRPWLDNLITTQADVSFQTRKGLDVLGASAPGAQSLSRSQGRADAWVVRADAHALFRITPLDTKLAPITFSGRFVSQWADRALLAYEEQAIGNLSIGRGYDPDAASGDRVWAGEVKLEIGPLRLTRAVKVTPYAFYDHARVTNLDLGSQNVTLRSLGGGLEVRIPYDKLGNSIRMDLGYAKPLDKTFPAQPNKPPDRWLVQFIITH
jgi:hemolysin activation/secretion protein